MYTTLVLFTHDTRCPYRTMVTLNYTEASPLIKVPSSLLPLLSEFFLPDSTQVPRIRLDTFLCVFNPNHITKLEKLVLAKFKISDRDLEILSEKLTDVQLSKLRIMASSGSGLTGSLSLLFKHSFPTLTTLTLWSCKLNSDDLLALSQASAEGKLPQLRDLDISENNTLKISDFFTNSVKWNQLKTLTTGDWNFLNAEPQFLTSLEELDLSLEAPRCHPLNDVGLI